MKTYDTGARTFGTAPFLQSLKGVVTRWLDRERELLSLRNAVGMMSEARRMDAAEYYAMAEGNKVAHQDAMRLRWLAEDHADPEVRARVASVLKSIPGRSLAGLRLDIDANMNP